MRAFRRSVAISIYHATEGMGSTRGVTITYPSTASVSTRGRFVPSGMTMEVTVGGHLMVADAMIRLDDDVDIRPLARSSYDEYPPDRVIIDSQKYIVMRAEKIASFGGVIHAWLKTERE